MGIENLPFGYQTTSMYKEKVYSHMHTGSKMEKTMYRLSW
jgi:hypothetical protein